MLENSASLDPDSNTDTSTDTSSNTDANTNDNLEKLFNEAELAVKTPATDHPTRPCLHIGESPLVKQLHPQCPTCLFYFCPDCASLLDPKYCRLCVSDAATELRSTPLIDSDGVKHEGRVLTPTLEATFYSPRLDVKGVTLAKSISEMSDFDLDEFISYYIHLVKQAELMLDRRRVVVGSAQMEKEQRQLQKRRKLAADSASYTKPASRNISVDSKTGKVNHPKTASAAKAPAVDMLKALEMLKALQELKKIKSVQPNPPEVNK